MIRNVPAIGFLVVATIVTGLVSCAVVLPGGGTGAAARIDHAAHLERGVDCADCHQSDTGWFETCMMCHEDLEESWPEEERLATVFFTPDQEPAWQRASKPFGEDIIFPHDYHQEMYECADCHKVPKGASRSTGVVLTMAQCQTQCHPDAGVSDDCTTCHTEMSADVAPRSHRQLWTERHGMLYLEGGDEAKQCSMCHDNPSWCESCHMDTAPSWHTNLWRTRTHGVQASIDRTRCQTCHLTDFCQRCHEHTPPRSHYAGWAHRPWRHCNGCHYTIGEQQGCRVCHITNPTHLTAPHMPEVPPHNPSLDCRLCHTPGGGGIAPMPHPDPGEACQRCHR